MKKFLSIFLVLVTMLAVCTSLVACGDPKPQLNLERAEKALEKNGYVVSVKDGDDYSGFMGYALEGYLLAHEKDDGDNIIHIYEFKTAKAARLYYNFIKMDYGKGSATYKFYKRCLRKYGDDMDKDKRKYIEDYLEELEEEVCGRSGRYVWCGTKDALNATK